MVKPGCFIGLCVQRFDSQPCFPVRQVNYEGEAVYWLELTVWLVDCLCPKLQVKNQYQKHLSSLREKSPIVSKAVYGARQYHSDSLVVKAQTFGPDERLSVMRFFDCFFSLADQLILHGPNRDVLKAF